MRLKLISLVVILNLSCTNSKSDDSYTYDDDVFANTLADLYLSEQVVRNYSFSKDSIKQVLIEQIYEIHGISDSSGFSKELNRLMKDTKKYKGISERVVKVLDSLETAVKK